MNSPAPRRIIVCADDYALSPGVNKAILDQYPLGTAPWRDVVFIARPGAGELAYPALVDEVARVFGSLA